MITFLFFNDGSISCNMKIGKVLLYIERRKTEPTHTNEKHDKSNNYDIEFVKSSTNIQAF